MASARSRFPAAVRARVFFGFFGEVYVRRDDDREAERGVWVFACVLGGVLGGMLGGKFGGMLRGVLRAGLARDDWPLGDPLDAFVCLHELFEA